MANGKEADRKVTMDKEQAVSLRRSDNYNIFRNLILSDVEKMKEELLTLELTELTKKQQYILGIRYVLNRLDKITQD